MEFRFSVVEILGHLLGTEQEQDDRQGSFNWIFVSSNYNAILENLSSVVER